MSVFNVYGDGARPGEVGKTFVVPINVDVESGNYHTVHIPRHASVIELEYHIRGQVQGDEIREGGNSKRASLDVSAATFSYRGHADE